MKFLRLLSLIILTAITPTLAQPAVGDWSITGPVAFPVNVSGQVHGMGRVSQLKFHATNPNKIYAVSASGGLYISTDTGRNWTVTPGTDALPTTACASVCVDYINDSILYLSTGDQDYYSRWYGIYKSTDGGLNWNPANTGIGNRMAVEILMDPTNHNILVAATDDGIWKTTNGGASWSSIIAAGSFRSMKQKPGTRVLYATTGLRFYRSLDFGSTWANITSGISVPSGNEGIRIAVSPADTNIVYLGTTDGYGQILKSTDGGTNFSTVYSSTIQCIVCYDSTITSGSQGYYNFNLTVNPTNANELLLGSHCVWRSTDGGVTWSWRTEWWNQVHTDMHHLEFDPWYPNLRFNANDGGVWLSRDPQATIWETRSEGLSATEMYHAAQSPLLRQMMSAGTQDNGELYFDGTWKCNRGGDWGPRCGIDYSGKSTVYYDNGSRRNLTPLGGDYTYNAPFTPSSTKFNIDFPKALPNTAFIGTDSIWISRNVTTSSPTWAYMYTIGEEIESIVSCTADSNVLYAITDNTHLLRCDNALAAGPSFAVLTAPAATNVAASLATWKNDALVVYLSCGSNLYRSGNKGVSWTNVTYTLPATNISKVIVDDYSPTERVFVCTGGDVYYKDNTTTTWTLTNGLPTVASVTDFMVYNDSTSGSILRVSTYGRGSWECNIRDNQPPSGAVFSNQQNLCPGDTVKFSKQIFGNLTSFSWIFSGGTPATSTLDSPIVVYSTPGVYDVKLVVTGPYGTDTIKKLAYINVSLGATAAILETFESAEFPPALWQERSKSGLHWQQAGTGGYGLSANCMMFDNFNNDAGGRRDRMLTPKADLTYATKAVLKFDVAYAYYPGYRDSLMILVSPDCGRNFIPVYVKDTNWLATAPDTTGFFAPGPTQWRTDSISLNTWLGHSVVVAFDNIGHYGQNIYIDNVNIKMTIPSNIGVTEIAHTAELNVYPNPVTSIMNIEASGLADGPATIDIFDITGRNIYHATPTITNGTLRQVLNNTPSTPGVYEVRVGDRNGYLVRKVVAQ